MFAPPFMLVPPGVFQNFVTIIVRIPSDIRWMFLLQWNVIKIIFIGIFNFPYFDASEIKSTKKLYSFMYISDSLVWTLNEWILAQGNKMFLDG